MKNAIALMGILLAFTNVTQAAHNSREFDSVAEAVRLVEESCGRLHVPGERGIAFPPRVQLTRSQCQAYGADLCSMEDRAMGGRWSRQLICYRGTTLLGGLDGSYEQGHDRGAGDDN